MGYIAEMQRKLLEQLMGAEAMGVIQAVRPCDSSPGLTLAGPQAHRPEGLPQLCLRYLPARSVGAH